jgi:diguanylate cyclase (GGDEF)-like protein
VYLVSRLRGQLEHEARRARTDGLTGALNWRAFVEEVSRLAKLALRGGGATTLVYLDVDDFKGINDTQGHAAGDRLLQAIHAAAVRSLRDSDVVARLGGDEFALLLPMTDENGARTVVERTRQHLADAVAAADQDPSIDFSQYDAMIIFHAGTLIQSSFNFLRFGDIPSATVSPLAVDYYLGHPILADNPNLVINVVNTVPGQWVIELHNPTDQEIRLRDDAGLKEIGQHAQMQAERALIIRVLEQTRGNKRKTAEILKIDYTTLFEKLNRYNIEASRN